ncbi:MAG: polyprenyl diphosphate synthase [Candidatus Woesearchaeota archaeon]
MKPKHVAISLERDITAWAQKNQKTVRESYELRAAIVSQLIRQQVNSNLPILTLFLVSSRQGIVYLDEEIDTLQELFEEVVRDDFIIKNQIKVSVLGKWYNLPGRVVDIIKCAIDQTKEYDKFFLNLCIMYDGQDEILDATKLIARRIASNKLDPDAITKAMIKEDIYTSYFLPPDLVIINGRKKLNGFLLWDSSNSLVYFTNKHWPDFKISDLIKAIDLYSLID